MGFTGIRSLLPELAVKPIEDHWIQDIFLLPTNVCLAIGDIPNFPRSVDLK